MDPNGNTLSKTKNGVTTTFLYDIRNQLGEVRQNVNVLGRYGYDSEGLRILKIGDDGIRRYTYDQLSVVTEAEQSNATVSKYDYGLDQLVRLNNITEGRSFFHLDILGSTVSLTEPAGQTRQSVLYDAWGNERDREGSSANRFTFTGHEKDFETDLVYAKARYYDPDVGRFLGQASLLGETDDAPSLNRYAYTRANPTRYSDPDGRTGEPVTTTTTITYAVEFEYVAGAGGAAGGAGAVFSVPGLGLIAAAIGGVYSVAALNEAEARLRLEEETAGYLNELVRRRGRIALEGEDDFERIRKEQVREQLRKQGLDLGDIDAVQTRRQGQKPKTSKEGFDGNSRLDNAKENEESQGGTRSGGDVANLDDILDLSEFDQLTEREKREIASRMVEGGELTVREPVERDPQAEGATRELLTEIRIAQQFPNGRILRHRLIVDREGKKILDLDTFTGRELDFVILNESGEVVAIRETTSPEEALRPRKQQQLEKTSRIRARGPTFIRDPETGRLIPLPPHVPEELMKEP